MNVVSGTVIHLNNTTIHKLVRIATQCYRWIDVELRQMRIVIARTSLTTMTYLRSGYAIWQLLEGRRVFARSYKSEDIDRSIT